jgi:hypothetical protein
MNVTKTTARQKKVTAFGRVAVDGFSQATRRRIGSGAAAGTGMGTASAHSPWRRKAPLPGCPALSWIG